MHTSRLHANNYCGKPPQPGSSKASNKAPGSNGAPDKAAASKAAQPKPRATTKIPCAPSGAPYTEASTSSAQKSNGIYVRFSKDRKISDWVEETLEPAARFRTTTPHVGVLNQWALFPSFHHAALLRSAESRAPDQQPDSGEPSPGLDTSLKPPSTTSEASKQNNFAVMRWTAAYIVRNNERYPFHHYAALDTVFRNKQPLQPALYKHYQGNMALVDSVHLFCKRTEDHEFPKAPYSAFVLLVVARPQDVEILQHTDDSGAFTHEEAVFRGTVFFPNGKLPGRHALHVATTAPAVRATPESGKNTIALVAASCVMYLKALQSSESEGSLLQLRQKRSWDGLEGIEQAGAAKNARTAAAGTRDIDTGRCLDMLLTLEEEVFKDIDENAAGVAAEEALEKKHTAQEACNLAEMQQASRDAAEHEKRAKALEKRKGAWDDLSDSKFRRFLFGCEKQTSEWLDVASQGLPENKKSQVNFNDIYTVNGCSVFVGAVSDQCDVGAIANTVFYEPHNEWVLPISSHFSAQVVLEIDKSAYRNHPTFELTTPFPSLLCTPAKSNFASLFVPGADSEAASGSNSLAGNTAGDLLPADPSPNVWSVALCDSPRNIPPLGSADLPPFPSPAMGSPTAFAGFFDIEQ